ncbi:hypothetical protein GCM10022377_15550 [Zhihengliuella alba]|uniref:Iron-binding zinc finger CDGSH type domain-containing protein n=1 Tax=Zhihengliuella alba TaxID=547018 RepID=A0ABP7DDV8_9MICC
MDDPTPAPQDSDAAAGPDIVLCPNGPLLVRGDFQIVDVTGQPVPANRRTVALCRCGGSAIKPFCDGTHKINGFDTGDH